MINSEFILNIVASFYSKRDKKGKIIGESVSYETLCANHLNLINFLNHFWIDIKLSQPKNEENVICI